MQRKIAAAILLGTLATGIESWAQDLSQRTAEVSIRRARGWSELASEGWCAIKVWVDDEAEFSVEGERLSIFTTRGQAARDVASECSAPLPRNVENFSFRGIDGRGDVRLLEQPSARNRWRAIVRIRDTKGGGEEYHYRLEWSRGALAGAGTGRGGRGNGSGLGVGPGGSDSGYRASGDLARMRTRELRRELERMANQAGLRRLSSDEVDDYIDRVRFDRWSADDVYRDMERRR